MAAVSWIAQFDLVWTDLEALQRYLSVHEIAGHGHCWLCGMSRAFRAIWGGHFRQATEYNAYSLVLFAIVVLGCTVVPFVARKIR